MNINHNKDKVGATRETVSRVDKRSASTRNTMPPTPKIDSIGTLREKAEKALSCFFLPSGIDFPPAFNIQLNHEIIVGWIRDKAKPAVRLGRNATGR